MIEPAEFLQEIEELTAAMCALAAGRSIAVVLPAAMTLVLTGVLSVGDRAEARSILPNLHNMVDYIEAQLGDLH